MTPEARLTAIAEGRANLEAFIAGESGDRANEAISLACWCEEHLEALLAAAEREGASADVIARLITTVDGMKESKAVCEDYRLRGLARIQSLEGERDALAHKIAALLADDKRKPGAREGTV